ncbi:Flp family type IVb pilin [Bremerella sp. P1]|uniref:Flp family type IVb pilin n=1 Tax=Bremerella sp. P1 TaxID=3026424 RepID=UPI0023677ABD|nr:hypothetical protein [Bremerella sp. P1]WDI40795.1 hypothetical protein PSR63_20190 [Bremerella sp. P1]
MLTTLKKIWNDERGFVNSMELILIATLAVLGLIVGLVTFRDAVMQELADTGAAVGQFNQSYSVFVGDKNAGNQDNGPAINEQDGVVTVRRNFEYVNVRSTFNNFEYMDQPDVGDGQDTDGDPPPGIISIGGSINEGEALP